MTTIGAIICSFNRRAWLLECIESVLQQSRPADEVIVILDGSTDGSEEAVRDLFPTVTVITQRNLGRSIAANRGIAASSCDYVALLDDDDMWHREKLARVDEYLSDHPDCGALNTHLWYFRGPGAPDRSYAPADFTATDLADCHAQADATCEPKSDMGYLDIAGRSERLLFSYNAGAYSSSVIRREIFQAVGGLAPAHSYGDDWSLFLNVARLCEWHTIGERLTFVRIHERETFGNPTATLATRVNAWFGGRPLRDRTELGDVTSLLRSYGPLYRREVRQVVWSAARAGDYREALLCLRLGRVLLVSFLDRSLVYAPLPIAWRVERRRAARRDRNPQPFRSVPPIATPMASFEASGQSSELPTPRPSSEVTR